MILVILIPTQVLLSLHSPGTILVMAPVKEYRLDVICLSLSDRPACDDLIVPVCFLRALRESSLNVRKGVFVSVIV